MHMFLVQRRMDGVVLSQQMIIIFKTQFGGAIIWLTTVNLGLVKQHNGGPVVFMYGVYTCFNINNQS